METFEYHDYTCQLYSYNVGEVTYWVFDYIKLVGGVDAGSVTEYSKVRAYNRGMRVLVRKLDLDL